MSNQCSPLHAVQAAAGATFTDFSGWQMPLSFQGILQEHQQVRQACGIFDLCHMGRLRLQGPQALDFLEGEICRPLASMCKGQVRYGLICEEDGGVVDDVLVSREAEQSWHVVVNAGNRQEVRERWQTALAAHACDCELSDISQEQAMLAVQGPDAAQLLADCGLDGRQLATYHCMDLQEQVLRLSRTGYTGEDGFELFLPADQAPVLWQRLVTAGAQPCGLGARDLLRLEAAMPLYGHELDRQHSPIEAGLGFAVGRQGSYRGAAVLQQQRRAGTTRCLVGLQLPGKRPARQGYPVYAGGQQVGVVTSGSWSPSCQACIALAFVEQAYAAIGNEVSVSLRGKSEVPAWVVERPFYRRKKPD